MKELFKTDDIKMDYTATLKKKLDGTFNILLELEYMKQSIVSISNKDSKYFDGSSKDSQFLHTVYNVFVRMFIVDLYKLIDKQSDFYLPKTVNFCKSNRTKITWHHEITNERLEKLEKKLLIPENIFEDIKTMRDKYYAHLDKNRFDYKVSVQHDELWNILKNYQEVFRIICSDFNNNCWIFKIQFKGVPELRYINNYKLLKELILECRKNGINTIETDKLFNLIVS